MWSDAWHELIGADPAQLMRSTWNITSQHKVLSIHRPFLSKRDKVAHDFSRRRVVLAAREILREGARLQRLPITVRIWTVLVRANVTAESESRAVLMTILCPRSASITSPSHCLASRLSCLKKSNTGQLRVNPCVPRFTAPCQSWSKCAYQALSLIAA